MDSKFDMGGFYGIVSKYCKIISSQEGRVERVKITTDIWVKNNICNLPKVMRTKLLG